MTQQQTTGIPRASHAHPALPVSGVHVVTCRWLCTVPVGTQCTVAHKCWCSDEREGDA